MSGCLLQLCALVLAGCCCLVDAAPLMILDMSHIMDNETEMWGFQASPNLEDVAKANGISDKWIANNFCTGEHVGTHIDAPSHIKINGSDNQQMVHEIPLENLFGPAVRINVKDKVKDDNNYAITVEDLKNHEKEFGAIPAGALIFSCTGWAEKYGKEGYWGSPDASVTGHWSFPGFSPESAEWLVENRKIKGIGADTGSCDVGQRTDTPVHKIILSKNVWCLEHVAKTCELPASGAIVYAFPIKVKDGSGIPVRVVATWGRGNEEDKDPNRTEPGDDEKGCDHSHNKATIVHSSAVTMFILSLVFIF